MLVASKGFNLRKLRLVGSNELTNAHIICFLATQSSLASLDLSFCKKLDQTIIPEVAKLTNLKSLHLDGTIGITDLAPLATLPALSTLTLYLSDVDDMAFEMISACKSLKRLDIQGTRTTEDVLRFIAPLSSLVELHLSEGCVSDQNTLMFKKMINLTNLSFVKCPNLFGIGYEHLATLAKVERLELRSQPALVNEEWSFLSNFRLLTQVSIIDMRDVGDEMLQYLAEAFHLSRLAVSPNSITFHGIAMIAHCPLKTLILKNGSLLDDGVIPVLMDGLTQLAHLNVQQCLGLTATGKSALEEWCKSSQITLLD